MLSHEKSLSKVEPVKYYILVILLFSQLEIKWIGEMFDKYVILKGRLLEFK